MPIIFQTDKSQASGCLADTILSPGSSTTDLIIPRCFHQQAQELTVLPSHWTLSELPNLLSPGKQLQVQLQQAARQQTNRSHPRQHPTLPWGEQHSRQPWPQVETRRLLQPFLCLPSPPC